MELEASEELAAEVELVDGGAEAGAVEEGAAAAGLLVAGCTGLGAPTPAMLDPSPSFCKLRAFSFPEASRPLLD